MTKFSRKEIYHSCMKMLLSWTSQKNGFLHRFYAFFPTFFFGFRNAEQVNIFNDGNQYGIKKC